MCTGAPDGIWDWYGRAQRYVTRARSARAPKGGSGGPPPGFFLKIAGKWCKSKAPWHFFQEISVYSLDQFYTVFKLFYC